jgi:hypothetical protein
VALALGPGTSRHRSDTNVLADRVAIRRWPLPALSGQLVACAAAASGLLLVQVATLLIIDTDPAVRVLLPATMAGLLPLAWLGRRLLGVRVMAAGLLLNLAAILANGGLMPIAPETVQAVAGTEELAQYQPGQRLPTSKDVLLAKGDTRLQALSDHVVLPLPGWFHKAASPGDLVIVLGIVVVVTQLIGRQGRAWGETRTLLREEPT